MPAVLEVVDVSRFWKESSVTPPPEMEEEWNFIGLLWPIQPQVSFPRKSNYWENQAAGASYPQTPPSPFSQNWELGNTFKAESMEACSCGWSFW